MQSTVANQMANSGKTTFDIMPRVGHKLSFPRDRHSAISYIRLLLELRCLVEGSSTQADLKESRSCECGLGFSSSVYTAR